LRPRLTAGLPLSWRRGSCSQSHPPMPPLPCLYTIRHNSFCCLLHSPASEGGQDRGAGERGAGERGAGNRNAVTPFLGGGNQEASRLRVNYTTEGELSTCRGCVIFRRKRPRSSAIMPGFGAAAISGGGGGRPLRPRRNESPRCSIPLPETGSPQRS
jgi:hypothetical protein